MVCEGFQIGWSGGEGRKWVVSGFRDDMFCLSVRRVLATGQLWPDCAYARLFQHTLSTSESKCTSGSLDCRWQGEGDKTRNTTARGLCVCACVCGRTKTFCYCLNFAMGSLCLRCAKQTRLCLYNHCSERTVLLGHTRSPLTKVHPSIQTKIWQNMRFPSTWWDRCCF